MTTTKAKPSKARIPALPDGAPSCTFTPEYYSVDGCAITLRDGSEEYPWKGHGVWLSPYEVTTGMFEGATGFASSDADRIASAFPAMRAGLARQVVWHDIQDPATGETLPQGWQNASAFSEWPSGLLFYVWSLCINGEPPEAREKES